MKTSFYVAIFDALAQETRLKVFQYIYQSGGEGVKPKEMIDKFGFDSGTLNFHLKKLVSARLIKLKIGGLRGVYCVNQNIPSELIRLFDSIYSANTIPMYSLISSASRSERHH